MKKWVFLVGTLLLSHQLYAGECEEARAGYEVSGTSRLSLVIQGKDSQFYPLEVRLHCRGVNGEALESASVVGGRQFLRSFASTGSLKSAEVRLTGDDMSGELEPEVQLVIAESPENASRYKVVIKWSERAPNDELYAKSFLYVEAYYTEYRFNSDRKWTPVPEKTRVPLRIRQEVSFATFEGSRIGLTTRRLIQQGDESSYIRTASAEYGEAQSDGEDSVSGCDIHEVSMGKFLGSCAGNYEFLVHGGHRVRGQFSCEFQLEHKSGVTEVVKEECEKQGRVYE